MISRNTSKIKDINCGSWLSPASSELIVILPIPSGDRVSSLAGLLSSEEVSRATKLLSSDAQIQFISTHALKRLVISSYLGVSPLSLVFSYDQHGKPHLCRQERKLFFNISHTRAHVGIFISTQGAVGLDLETERTSTPWRDLIEHTLHPNELAGISWLNPQVFYRYWTLKEALSKAIGYGLSIPFNSLSLVNTIDDNDEYHICYSDKDWRLKYLKIGSDTHVAYSHANTATEIQIVTYE